MAHLDRVAPQELQVQMAHQELLAHQELRGQTVLLDHQELRGWTALLAHREQVDLAGLQDLQEALGLAVRLGHLECRALAAPLDQAGHLVLVVINIEQFLILLLL